MQDRTHYSDSNLLITSDGSNEDVFSQSMNKLNICGQTHCNYSKLANNYYPPNVSPLEANTSNTSQSKPKILEIQTNTSVLIGESVNICVHFSDNCLSKASVVWSKKVCHYLRTQFVLLQLYLNFNVIKSLTANALHTKNCCQNRTEQNRTRKYCQEMKAYPQSCFHIK